MQILLSFMTPSGQQCGSMVNTGNAGSRHASGVMPGIMHGPVHGSLTESLVSKECFAFDFLISAF